MRTPLANKKDVFFAQAEDMYDGLVRYGSDLDQVSITDSVLRNAILTAEAAVRGFDEARAARRAAVVAQTAADDAGKRFIRAARNVIAVQYGELYSETWAPTGFPNQSTSIPTTMAERQTLLRALQNFFANHGAFENAPMGVTAVQAGILFNGLSDARSLVNNCYDISNASKAERDAKLGDLRRKMLRLIQELELSLAADDPRWYSFGLTPPAAPETPEMVEEVVLTIGGSGIVLASWTNPPRAGRYRVLKQIVGVDAEFVTVETVYDTQFTFTGLPAGKTLRVQIVSANEAGTGDPSETVEIVIA